VRSALDLTASISVTAVVGRAILHKGDELSGEAVRGAGSKLVEKVRRALTTSILAR